MRIIFHHRTQLADAQGIHIGATARAFQDLGHEVDLISALGSWRGDAVQGRPLARIQTHLLPRFIYEMLSLTYNLYGYMHLARALRQRRYDLIYERYALNSFCGVVASRRFGMPLLLEVNGPWHDHSPFLKPLLLQKLARRLQRWACSNSTHTIVVTAALKQLLIEEGVPERKLTSCTMRSIRSSSILRCRAQRCAGDTA
jgi:Glycosyltransferase Family 4